MQGFLLAVGRRHAVHAVKCLLAITYPNADADKLLLLVVSPAESMRTDKLKTSLHQNFSALLFLK
jgi:hypothetical protein